MPRNVGYPLPTHPELSKIITYDSTNPPDRNRHKGGDGPEEDESVLCVEYRVMAERSGEVNGVKGAVWWMWRSLMIAVIWWSSRRQGLRQVLGAQGNELVWDLLAGSVCAGLLYISCSTLISESALALPGLGMQLNRTTGIPIPVPQLRRGTISFHRYHLRERTASTFIPIKALTRTNKKPSRADADCIFINEGFRRWSVKYYLGIMLKEERRDEGKDLVGGEGYGQYMMRRDRKVKVVFEGLTPGLRVLQEVYHGLRETMFDDYAEG